MSTINVNDGSINFGYKNIKDFTTLDSATDVQYLLATQDNNDGCKILKETLIDYIGTQGGFATQEALDTKQPLLVSGQNLKTINGVSLLDSGNITIAQGDMINDSAPSLNTVYSSSKVEDLISIVSDSVFNLFEDKCCLQKPTDKWVAGGTGAWISATDKPKAWEYLTNSKLYKFDRYSSTYKEVYTDKPYDDVNIGDNIYNEKGEVLGTVTNKYISGIYQYININIDSYPRVYNGEIINKGYKTTTDTYTDYDIVVNETAQTFRLPILPKSKMVVNSGSSIVGNSRYDYIIYSDKTIQMYGTYSYTIQQGRTLQGDIWFSYLKDTSQDKISIVITPYNEIVDTERPNTAPIANIGITKYVNSDGDKCQGFHFKVYGYSSTDTFKNVFWQVNGTLADEQTITPSVLNYKTYYYLG